MFLWKMYRQKCQVMFNVASSQKCCFLFQWFNEIEIVFKYLILTSNIKKDLVISSVVLECVKYLGQKGKMKFHTK